MTDTKSFDENTISFDALMQYLTIQGEKAFKEQIIHLEIEIHCLEINRLYVKYDAAKMCEWIEKVTEWLNDNFNPESFLAFPMENAVGKYKHCSNSVFFKNKSDAMLFKLTWI